jgi:uncharacterized protein
MGVALPALRVNTVELFRQPGVRKTISESVPAAALEVDDARIRGPIGVELTVESTVDGIVVTGALTVEWDDECRRCLRALVPRVELAVDELYQREASDADAFELGTDALDLAPLVRDGVLLALAGPPPLCRDDCAGICPVCGVDRNESPCDCETAVADDRWAALADLHLDDPE